MTVFIYQWFCDGLQEIRGYGITPNNNTICLRVIGFRPGFYAESSDLERIKQLTGSHKVNAQLRTRHHLYSSHGRDVSFVWLDFDCWFEVRKAFDTLVKADIKCHQARAQPILQLLSRAKLPACGWIKCRTSEPIMDEKYSRCKKEKIVHWTQLRALTDKDEQPKIVMLALDLEVYSEDENSMPKDRAGDIIFMAGVVICKPDCEPRRILLSLCGSDYNLLANEIGPESIEVREYETERDLLIALCNLIKFYRPQVLCGYNVLGFDIDYMLKRCARLGVDELLRKAGLALDKLAKERVISWSSVAFGAQNYRYIDWEGIVIVDLLPVIRRDYKFDSYRLDFVTEQLLGTHKDPVTYQDIFKSFKNKRMAIVGKYCVKDAQLCIDLMKKLDVWVGLTEMAKICQVSAFTLFTQGQQIRIYSQVYYHCENNNYVVTDLQGGKKNIDPFQDDDTNTENYIGAHVVEPIPGLYDNVVPLDFSSLYPSIMIAKNICYSTQANINDQQTEIFEWEDHQNCMHDPRLKEYKSISLELWDLECEAKKLRKMRDSLKAKSQSRQDIQDALASVVDAIKSLQSARASLKNTLGTKTVCAIRKLAFFKSSYIKGIIPTILLNLLEGRTKAKLGKANAQDSVTRIVFDKRQLAYKMSANSMYGAMGVKKGYLPFQEGAMTITHFGRLCIEKAANLIAVDHGGVLVYGDTDSNYVTFTNISSTQELWNKAEETAKAVSTHFPPPILLEFECVIYQKFLILGKKRYLYLSCDKDGVSDNKLGYRGVIIARRDNSGFARQAYRLTAQALLENRDACTELHSLIDDMYRGYCDLKEFVITKQVGSWSNEFNFVSQGKDSLVTVGNYKIRDVEKAKVQAKDATHDCPQEYLATLYRLIMRQLPGHVQLANRMLNRGDTVAEGTRLEYVVLQAPYHGRKRRFINEGLAPRLEVIDYYRRHRNCLLLDYDYYLKSLINPIDQLLETAGIGSNIVKSWYTTRVAYHQLIETFKTLRVSPELVKTLKPRKIK